MSALSKVPLPLRLFGLGLMLGVTLHGIGFTSWDAVHGMFTFTDLRMFLSFGVGVLVLGVAFHRIERKQSPGWPPRPIHRGTVLGSVLFGVGWALSGGCPGVVLTQLGEGHLYALFSLAGIFIGNAAYGAFVEERLGTASKPALAIGTAERPR